MSAVSTKPAVDAAPERTLTAQLMPLVQDLARHRPAVYWADFLVSIGVFWAAFAAFAWRAPVFDTLAGMSFLVAVLALYRAAVFMHEIVHLPRNALPGFRWCWNALCGIPMLLPAYLYASHIDHHGVKTYGTRQDPEYLPLLRGSAGSMALLVGGTLLTPALLWVRFAILAPLAWCVPALRALVDERFSSATLHPYYRADAGRLLRPLGAARAAELLAMAWAWTATALVAGGVLPLHWALSFAAVTLCVLLLNMVRTVFAHHYAHAGAGLTHGEQLADSVTLGNAGPWIELLAPLGLRYHALHHLFPYLPYHALGAAHARLLAAGPAALAYHRTEGAPRAMPGSQAF